MLHLQIKLNVLSNALTLTPLTPFSSLSSINNERYSGGPGVEVEKILKVTRNSLFKEPVVIERFLEERSNLLFRSTSPSK